MHDFPATARHAVVPEMPLYFNVQKLLLGGRSGAGAGGGQGCGGARGAGAPRRPRRCAPRSSPCAPEVQASLGPALHPPPLPVLPSAAHLRKLLMHAPPLPPLSPNPTRPPDAVFMDWAPADGTTLHVVDLASGARRAFRAPPCFVFHWANAFESADGRSGGLVGQAGGQAGRRAGAGPVQRGESEDGR